MKLLLACLTLFFFYNFPNLTNINVLTHNSKRAENEGLTQNLRADSIHIDNTVALMQSAYRKKNWKKANQVAHEVLIKAKELQNIPYLAKAKNYLGNLHLKEAQYDSAYYYFYNAGKDYRVLGDSLRLGKTLLNMSIIEKNVNDYYTAINTATKAEQLIRPYKENRVLGSLYNNLGIISNELSRYNQSIEYHKKSLEYRRKIKNPSPHLPVGSINNLAVVFQNQKKYIQAKDYLEKALQYENIIDYPKEYSTILDNLGYTYFLLKNNKKSRYLLNKALQIREKHNDVPGKIVSYLHLAELQEKSNILETKKMLNKAISLSKEIGNTRDLITSLKLMALTESPNNDALSKYIALNDSIIKQQSVSSLKLNRIKYESDLLIQEKLNAFKLIRLQKEQLHNRNIIILMLFIIVTLILVLIYWIYKAYRHRIKLHREFNHRVRNNLNHISYYVLKLKKQTGNISFVQGVKELETVIQTQQLIHSTLEKSGTFKVIDLHRYTETVIQYIVKSHIEFNVNTHFNTNKSQISPEKASIIGIIINEFLTNAFKYGFNTDDKNDIYLFLKKGRNKRIHLQLECSGYPWKPNIHSRSSSSGLFIMESLAKNIGSTINIYFEKRSILQLIIPLKTV